MIRVFAFIGVFLLSIIGLLLLQPGERSASVGFDVTRNSSDTMLARRADALSGRDAPAGNLQLVALQNLQHATDANLSKQAMSPAKSDMRTLTSSALANLRTQSPSAAKTGQHRLASLVSQSMGAVGDNAFLNALLREAKYGTEEFVRLAMIGAARSTSGVKTRWIASARKQSKAMADATAFMSSGTQKTPGFDDTIHIVKQGDSLMKLSVRYYGRTIDYQLIYEANRTVLESPDKIRIGQKLKIPPMTNA
ncbi:MAG: LysM peptidoglycan-binding domain-containing protein [Planktotalea arctica]